MSAVINNNWDEIIECGNGLLETVYRMLGGKKDFSIVNEILLYENDEDPDAILKIFESVNNRGKRIEAEDLKPKLVSKDEIEFDLEVIKNILFYSYDLLGDAKASWRESFGGDAPEEYFFAARMGYTHWGMCVIELSKLFINSRFQEFNLYSLIDKIEVYKNGKGLPNKIKSIDTKKYREALKVYENEKIIEKLRILRNKVFAHADRNFHNSGGIELNFLDLEKLQETTLRLLKELNETIFDIKIEEYEPNNAVESILGLLNKELRGI